MKCNGYSHICGFKGKPIIEVDFSFDKKPNLGRFCIDCCRHFLKCHPELEKEHPDWKAKIEKAILQEECIAVLGKQKAVK